MLELSFSPLMTSVFLMQLWPAGCQFVLMIGFVLPKKRQDMGRWAGIFAIGQLSWLVVERTWSALALSFLSFLVQTGIETTPLPLWGLHFWHWRLFSVERSVHWSESPDHCKLALIGHGRGYEHERIDERTLSPRFQCWLIPKVEV